MKHSFKYKLATGIALLSIAGIVTAFVMACVEFVSVCL